MIDKEKLKPSKLIRKIPMQKKVIDNESNLWIYEIQNKKTIYKFLANLHPES